MIYQRSLYPNCIMFSYGEFKPSESHQNGAPAYFGAEKVTPFTWLIFYFLRSGNWLWGDFLPARLELTSLLNSCNRFKEVQPSKQIRFWKRNAPRLKETFIVCYCCAYCLCWGKFRLKKIRKTKTKLPKWIWWSRVTFYCVLSSYLSMIFDNCFSLVKTLNQFINLCSQRTPLRKRCLNDQRFSSELENSSDWVAVHLSEDYRDEWTCPTNKISRICGVALNQ